MNVQSMTSKLNHMSFPTNDVAATARFFEKYLGFSNAMEVAGKYAILKRPGFDVVIENAVPDAPTIRALANTSDKAAFADCVNEGSEARWPRSFHIGLEFPTLDDLRVLRDSLVDDGYAAETEIFNNDRGSRFFLRAPGGVLVEFNTRSDASEAYRGSFDN